MSLSLEFEVEIEVSLVREVWDKSWLVGTLAWQSVLLSDSHNRKVWQHAFCIR